VEDIEALCVTLINGLDGAGVVERLTLRALEFSCGPGGFVSRYEYPGTAKASQTGAAQG